MRMMLGICGCSKHAAKVKLRNNEHIWTPEFTWFSFYPTFIDKNKKKYFTSEKELQVL